jgi:hypothetical protein
MTRIWIVAALAALLTLAGCGAGSGTEGKEGQTATSSSSSKAVQGEFVFQMTPEVEAQLKKNEDALAEIKKKAAAGDPASVETLKALPAKPKPEKELLAGMKLRLKADSSFTMNLPDARTDAVLEVAGTYALDPGGIKLKLTITKVNGEQAEGADAKTVELVFDEKALTLTGDLGVGPKLVLKKR